MKPITPQELRIGLYFYKDEYEKRNGIFTKITLKDLRYLLKKIDEEREYYLQPVELTEEILLRLGFEKVENKETYFIQVGEYGLYVTVNGFSGTLEKPQSWFCSVSTGYASQPMTVIKMYLHELQNLYFSLCGKELELKPKQ